MNSERCKVRTSFLSSFMTILSYALPTMYPRSRAWASAMETHRKLDICIGGCRKWAHPFQLYLSMRMFDASVMQQVKPHKRLVSRLEQEKVMKMSKGLRSEGSFLTEVDAIWGKWGKKKNIGSENAIAWYMAVVEWLLNGEWSWVDGTWWLVSSWRDRQRISKSIKLSLMRGSRWNVHMSTHAPAGAIPIYWPSNLSASSGQRLSSFRNFWTITPANACVASGLNGFDGLERGQKPANLNDFDSFNLSDQSLCDTPT